MRTASEFNFPGWRWFGLLEGKPLLRSITNIGGGALTRRFSYYKYFGPVSSIPPHKAIPDVNNTYGFWSFRRREHLLLEYHPDIFVDTHVLAEIAHFGTVVEHDYGYRSSKLLIWRLYVSSALTKLVPALEERYQCECSVDPLKSQYNIRGIFLE